jgi:hypothetical protein
MKSYSMGTEITNVGIVNQVELYGISFVICI